MTEAPIDLDLPDLDERIRFLFPDFDDDAAELEDEGLRLELISDGHTALAEHEQLEDDRFRLHTSMHLVVANQVLADNPPEVWPTLQRIVARGYTSHDALHMVAAGMSEAIWHAMKGRPQSPEIYLQYLAGLPEQSVRSRPAPTSRTGGGPARRSTRKRKR